MEEITDVEKILLYLQQYALRKGYYSKLKVETSVDNSQWVVCKGEFAAEISPYEVKCDQETFAKFVRISTGRYNGLRLREVKVIGVMANTTNIAPPPPTTTTATTTIPGKDHYYYHYYVISRS